MENYYMMFNKNSNNKDQNRSINRDSIEEAYRIGQPILTDKEYDKIFHDKLSTSMLSMEAYYDINKLFKFLSDKFHNEHWIIEPKVDGVSIQLNYIYGKLTNIYTRGAKSSSTDVYDRIMKLNTKNILNNINKLQDIPNFKIRGELLISKKNFMPYKNDYHTARNLTAGAIFSINKTYPNQIIFDFIPFEYNDNKSKDYLSDRQFFHDTFDTMHIIGETKDIHNNQMLIQDCLNKIVDYKFDADGIVLKLNNYNLRHTVGNTNSINKWQLALKPPGQLFEGIVMDIQWNIGRSSNIFPILIIHSKDINVKKIYIYNITYIQKYFLGKNAIIYFSMNSGIIPIIHSTKQPSSELFEMIKSCPSCNNLLDISDNKLKCRNEQCFDKLVYILKYSLSCVLLKGIGTVGISKLIKNHIINLSNILNTNLQQYIDILGNKIGTKFFNQLQDKKLLFTANQIMCSFNIPFLNKNFWQKMRKCNIFNLQDFINNIFKLPNEPIMTSMEKYYLNKYINKNLILQLNQIIINNSINYEFK